MLSIEKLIGDKNDLDVEPKKSENQIRNESQLNTSEFLYDSQLSTSDLLSDQEKIGFDHPEMEIKRNTKPMMEKRRRARINSCLNDLKDLILAALKKDTSRHSKLEKADILEMTVNHLQTLQRQKLAMAVAVNPAVLNKFKSGFNECAQEVTRYISRIDGVDWGIRERLTGHLTQTTNNLNAATPLSFITMASPRDPSPVPTVQKTKQVQEEVGLNRAQMVQRLLAARLAASKTREESEKVDPAMFLRSGLLGFRKVDRFEATRENYTSDSKMSQSQEERNNIKIDYPATKPNLPNGTRNFLKIRSLNFRQKRFSAFSEVQQINNRTSEKETLSKTHNSNQHTNSPPATLRPVPVMAKPPKTFIEAQVALKPLPLPSHPPSYNPDQAQFVESSLQRKKITLDPTISPQSSNITLNIKGKLEGQHERPLSKKRPLEDQYETPVSKKRLLKEQCETSPNIKQPINNYENPQCCERNKYEFEYKKDLDVALGRRHFQQNMPESSKIFPHAEMIELDDENDMWRPW